MLQQVGINKSMHNKFVTSFFYLQRKYDATAWLLFQLNYKTFTNFFELYS